MAQFTIADAPAAKPADPKFRVLDSSDHAEMEQMRSTGTGDYFQEMGKTFTGDIEGAWDQLKSDYTTMHEPIPQDAGVWYRVKDDFHKNVAAGRLPFDAFQLAISPVTAAVHAGPVKALAHGERGLESILTPGGDKPLSEDRRRKLSGILPAGRTSIVPSQEEAEGTMMTGLSLLAPEKGSITLPRAGSGAVPTVDDLKAQARTAYSIVDKSGMRINNQAIADLKKTIDADLKAKGFNTKLMPKTQVALDELGDMAKPAKAGTAAKTHTLQDVDVLRRVAGHAAGATEKPDRMMARIVQDHIDDFVDNLQANHLSGAPDPAALKALGEARTSWKRASKGEIIDRAIEKAKTSAQSFSQSGMENALRSRFRQIANNDRAMRRFAPEEQEAIKKVARGGPIGNALRQLGKFAPHGVISTTMGGGLGYAVGGPYGAAAVLGGGKAAQLGAEAITMRNARMASEMMRRGGPAVAARLGISPAQAAALTAALGTRSDNPGAASVQQQLGIQ